MSLGDLIVCYNTTFTLYNKCFALNGFSLESGLTFYYNPSSFCDTLCFHTPRLLCLFAIICLSKSRKFVMTNIINSQQSTCLISFLCVFEIILYFYCSLNLLMKLYEAIHLCLYMTMHWFFIKTPLTVFDNKSTATDPVSEYCFLQSLSSQSWHYRDKKKPEVGNMRYPSLSKDFKGSL